MPASDARLTYEDVEGAILVACYQCHQDGRPLPGYAEIGALAGRGEDWGRAVMQGMLSDGLLVGMAGRKPTGMSEAGKAKAQPYLQPGVVLQMANPSTAVVAPTQQAPRSMLVEELANRWGIDAGRMFELVSKTMISKRREDGPASKEEVAMVMHVMRQYDLDPILKQLHAFISDGRLQIMLGYDGWVKEVNKARAGGCLGISLRDSEAMVKVPGTTHECPAWVEATLTWATALGRVPTVYKAMFSEWFVPNQNWKARPYHRLRMKAYCQAAREGLGIGLADEVDRDQFQWRDDPDARMQEATATRTMSITERLNQITYEEPEEAIIDGSGEPSPRAQDDAGEALGGQGMDDGAEASGAPQGPVESDEELDKRLLQEQVDRGEV